MDQYLGRKATFPEDLNLLSFFQDTLTSLINVVAVRCSKTDTSIYSEEAILKHLS